MEDNRLNLDAPLLSVRRRFSAPPAAAAKKPPPSPSPRRSSLPLYKPELNSTPARARGVVPFAWEKAPGQPKRSLRTAPRRGCTPDRPPVPPKPPPGSSVSGSKIGESSDDDGDVQDEDEQQRKGFSDAVQLRSKSCRLIPKLWSKIPNCFWSPMTKMNIRSCLPRPQVKTLQFENVNSWEAVYRYRLGSCDSKLRSESNQISYWSDSGTHEGSSSFRHSDTTGLMDFTDEDFEIVVDGLRAKQSRLIDHCEANAVIPEIADVFAASDCKLLCQEMNLLDDSLVLKAEGEGDGEKSDDGLALSILPPPLPKSPSESWLLRAVSAKNRPPPQSLLAMQFQPRSQSFRYLSVKSSKMSSRSLRFTEFIAKPTSPQSAS